MARLIRFDPTLNEGMTLKEIVTQYNRNRLQRASELSGIPVKQIQRNIDRQKNEELARRRMNQGVLEKDEVAYIGSLFDEEQPIVQQHAEELMAENPDLDANEAVREAQDNVLEARPLAQELQQQLQQQQQEQQQQLLAAQMPEFVSLPEPTEEEELFFVGDYEHSEPSTSEPDSLHDSELPIHQQHAEELMADNPALDPNEANREARDNIRDARPLAQELQQ